MRKYVLGFLFNYSMTQVLLMKKQKPEWQRGMINGIGGNIEPGETPKEAMIREFKEEAGLDSNKWELFCILSGEGFELNCFYTFANTPEVRQMEEEEIVWVDVESLRDWKTLPNVQWLVPMALSFEVQNRSLTFKVQEVLI